MSYMHKTIRELVDDYDLQVIAIHKTSQYHDNQRTSVEIALSVETTTTVGEIFKAVMGEKQLMTPDGTPLTDEIVLKIARPITD